ncbi:hypothetical protein JDV02_003752 [Purpureocillium takamizusanense]|uniref:BTB domain-containing protein n=1 Tax=Purpureocillium takamizusanense TaxID=2060973 RepID=A0A9Q8QD06_9HYPO|nr:uncharacterized protein JDV02_003752 [Purpureocillium takamizusanense]UNI17410.1 hypothetical protein JDV02_003752 [Purpureocillium takamizusanense]
MKPQGAGAAATLPPSPYASRVISLAFDGTTLRIHEQFLAKEPWLVKKLTDEDQQQASRSRKSPELNLKHISHHVGHVLVHYLVTGSYDCLKAEGVSPDESTAQDFTTALRVYAVCRQHDMKSLRDLAKNEIKWLGGKITIPRMVDAIEEGYPAVPPEDEWFPEYLRSQMEAFHDGLTMAGAADALEEIGQPLTVSKMLLSSIAENFVYCNQAKGASPPIQERTTREWADEVNLASDLAVQQSDASTYKKQPRKASSPGPTTGSAVAATPASESVPPEDNDTTLAPAVSDMHISDLSASRWATPPPVAYVDGGGDPAKIGPSKKSGKRKQRAKKKKATAKLRNEENAGATLNEAGPAIDG